MVVLGYIFLVLLALGVLAVLVGLLVSLPDIRKYVTMSRM